MSEFTVTNFFLSRVTQILEQVRRAVTGHIYRTPIRADTVWWTGVDSLLLDAFLPRCGRDPGYTKLIDFLLQFPTVGCSYSYASACHDQPLPPLQQDLPPSCKINFKFGIAYSQDTPSFPYSADGGGLGSRHSLPVAQCSLRLTELLGRRSTQKTPPQHVVRRPKLYRTQQ